MPNTPKSYAIPEEDNPQHRCLFCAKRMPEQIDAPKEGRPRWDNALSVEENKAIERRWLHEHRTPSGEYGRYRDNAFCSPGCAHSFALAARPRRVPGGGREARAVAIISVIESAPQEALMRTCVVCEQSDIQHGLIVNGKLVCLTCARRIAKAIGAERPAEGLTDRLLDGTQAR